MRNTHHTPSKRRREARDPITRGRRRDFAATLEREYARELAHEARAAMLDRFWDRRFA